MDSRDLFDIFDEGKPASPPESAAPAAAAAGCGRPGCLSDRREIGNVCFLSDAAFFEYCRDQAKLKAKALAVELAAMPVSLRAQRIEKFREKGWSADRLQWLARRAAAIAESPWP